eukprot:TRINITY_DN7213_c0_g1_i1.p1 TRINITY_DN7213_c0_g1~~TRINITY_DN7213_c0_g1_i1.p1  ORF type:complete len:280 (-),score=99.00 TRINITY_DN7213_c0_g1_i1:20-859(-)
MSEKYEPLTQGGEEEEDIFDSGFTHQRSSSKLWEREWFPKAAVGISGLVAFIIILSLSIAVGVKNGRIVELEGDVNREEGELNRPHFPDTYTMDFTFIYDYQGVESRNAGTVWTNGDFYHFYFPISAITASLSACKAVPAFHIYVFTSNSSVVIYLPGLPPPYGKGDDDCETLDPRTNKDAGNVGHEFKAIRDWFNSEATHTGHCNRPGRIGEEWSADHEDVSLKVCSSRNGKTIYEFNLHLKEYEKPDLIRAETWDSQVIDPVKNLHLPPACWKKSKY